jgi:ribosomal protein L22
MAEETPDKPKRPRRRRRSKAEEAPEATSGTEATKAASEPAPKAKAKAANEPAPKAKAATGPKAKDKASSAREPEPPAEPEPAAAAEPDTGAAARPGAAADDEQETRAATSPAKEASDQPSEEAEPQAEKPSRRQREAPARPQTSRRRGSRQPADAPPVVVRAKARYVRSSARKARLVCDHIRGKSVEDARAILAHAPRAVARDWSKVLESAVANAEHNHELVGEDLYVKAIHADEGPTIKRYRPRALGRATGIRKRTSHLTILLTPKE